MGLSGIIGLTGNIGVWHRVQPLGWQRLGFYTPQGPGDGVLGNLCRGQLALHLLQAVLQSLRFPSLFSPGLDLCSQFLLQLGAGEGPGSASYRGGEGEGPGSASYRGGEGEDLGSARYNGGKGEGPGSARLDETA